MDASLRWINDFVDINDIDIKTFIDEMTMSGSKVEGYTVEGSDIKNVVVGKVLEIEKHPDADKLVVCKIDVGKDDPLQIVTGATNLFVGAVIPVALHKSTLPGGKQITKGKLRGVESMGMLCSLSELGLTEHDFPYAIEDGIFVIEEDCEIGQDIQSAIGLNDTCVEFEITPNRPDCLSILGISREVSATFKKTLDIPYPNVKGSGGDINSMLSVKVENSELCPRYVAKIVKNVKIEPSPRWMRERLRACGVRPINNLVDITNYVMLEYGQPMHAFDLNHISDGQIVVRTAEKDEKFVTLDGNERKLDENMLMICDNKKSIGIAGVMGGENSEILDSTSTIVFESASFNGTNVRATSNKLGLRTEASTRFEKGLDAAGCLAAVLRACELVEILGAGEIVDGVIDVDNSDTSQTVIDLDQKWINNLLGTDIPKDNMIDMLTRLGCSCKDDKITVPTFRKDLENKADLSEEVARLFGYNNIPTTILRGEANGKFTETQQFERKVIDIMISSGANEVLTYSFISPKQYDKIMLPEDSPQRKSVVITNPLGEETSIMRSTTVPSILEILSRNYNNRNADALIFEVGTQYEPVDGQQLPNEPKKLTIGAYGDGIDFFTIKGIVEALFDKIHLNGWSIEATTDNPTCHPGRTANLTVGDNIIGYIGEVHPEVLTNYEIGTRAYIAYLDMETMYENSEKYTLYTPLPKFPATSRDLALICDEELPVLKIENTIKKVFGDILEKLKLFDVYRGSQIEQGKKSVAYSLTLRSKSGTLTDTEVDAKIQKTLKALGEIGANLRQ